MSIEETINKPVVYFKPPFCTPHVLEREELGYELGFANIIKLVDIYASADQLAIANYFTHKAIEKALSSSLPEAREYLIARVVDILNVYRKN